MSEKWKLDMTCLVLVTDATLRKVGEPKAPGNPKEVSASSPGPQQQGH